MANKPKLLDQWGNPVQRATLKEEIAAPTLTGVRSPITGYPGDGLNPARLAAIMRAADAGDPVRYLELAETIEERDLHYLGVLGTRRRSVSQIEITVKPADDSAEAERDAQQIRDWLERDELRQEVFDVLDAIGKGYSFTEIVWDSSMGQWQPERLERRDQRWFRFERHNLTVPLMLGEGGREEPLPAFKFIFARMQAKSGVPIRSGLARAVLWAYLFKKYTERDWAIFTQTYGQPLRVGKYGAGASDQDKDTLFKAVANIAGDCAAIVPDSMLIEFIESGNVGSSTDHYERRADWYDKQISKAVLGQTATTDSVTGGLGSGKEHREVQEDIETADCSQLAAILNRQMIRPWIELNRGPQERYPRLIIARPDEEDVKAWTEAAAPWADRGLPIPTDTIYAKLGLSKPDDAPNFLGKRPAGDDPGRGDATKTAASAPLNTHSIPSEGSHGAMAAAQSEGAQRGAERNSDPAGLIAERMAEEAAAPIEAMLDRIEAMIEHATSLPELREMVLAAYPDLDNTALVDLMARAFVAAHLGGRAMVEDEAGE